MFLSIRFVKSKAKCVKSWKNSKITIELIVKWLRNVLNSSTIFWTKQHSHANKCVNDQITNNQTNRTISISRAYVDCKDLEFARIEFFVIHAVWLIEMFRMRISKNSLKDSIELFRWLIKYLIKIFQWSFRWFIASFSSTFMRCACKKHFYYWLCALIDDICNKFLRHLDVSFLFLSTNKHQYNFSNFDIVSTLEDFDQHVEILE